MANELTKWYQGVYGKLTVSERNGFQSAIAAHFRDKTAPVLSDEDKPNTYRDPATGEVKKLV